jgi:hypothetical protein
MSMGEASDAIRAMKTQPTAKQRAFLERQKR